MSEDGSLPERATPDSRENVGSEDEVAVAPARAQGFGRGSGRAFPAPSNRALAILLGCILLYWACFFIRDAIAQFVSIDWSRAGKGDVAVDWRAAALFWRGVSPYSPEGLTFVGVKAFGHPPTTPFWFLPLYELDHASFGQFIGTLDMGMALALVAVVIFALQVPMAGLVTALVFGVLQAMPPALEQARVIQISVWIAFAYALAWVWLRNGKDVRAGCALGFACTLKFFPGLLILFLVLERRWRAVAASAISFLVVAAVMTWRWGVEAWPLFFSQQSSIAARWLPDVRNASLHGIIRRALAPECSKVPVDDPRATFVIISIALTLLAAATWLWYRARSRQRGKAFDYAFVLFSVLSCFLNPWVWEHYFYILVLPALLGWHAVAMELVRASKVWLDRRAGWQSLGWPAVGVVLAAAPTYVGFLAYQNIFRTNSGAHLVACKEVGHGPVDVWLMREAHYLELINWLPWAFTIVLFMALLAYITLEPTPSSEPR